VGGKEGLGGEERVGGKEGVGGKEEGKMLVLSYANLPNWFEVRILYEASSLHTSQ